MSKPYEPKSATRFYDLAYQRNMLLNHDEGEWYGWLFWQHSDGQWVSLRKATDEDRRAINAAISNAHHKEPTHE